MAPRSAAFQTQADFNVLKHRLDEADETWAEATFSIHSDRRATIRSGRSVPGMGSPIAFNGRVLRRLLAVWGLNVRFRRASGGLSV